jgi:DNA-3-methyladenine glycosylase
MHYCLNVVAEPDGVAGCVLIRAVEPISGLVHLSDGPGKLTRALGITLEHYGADLTRGPLTIHTPSKDENFEVVTSPRIGINKAADLPLRFYIRGNRFVSRAPRR